MATDSSPQLERSGDGTREGSTEPVDYATLNAVWGALLASVVVATRRTRSVDDPLRAAELLPMTAATFALSKVIARERIGTWVREPFVEDGAEAPHPRGRRLQRAVGELVTCSRCVGAWSALGIVGLRLLHPHAGRTATAVLASSAGNDFLQASFRWLCGKTNQTSS